MTRKEFEQKRYEISVCAGMNQRYHQSYASFWIGCDRFVRISVGVLAVAGASLTVVSAMIQKPSGQISWADILCIVIASLAAVAAIILNVLPFGEWSAKHRELFGKWTDLREDIDSLEGVCAGEPSAELIEQLHNLGAKVNRIGANEPACDDAFLDDCCTKEERSRQPGKCAA
jgi:hypothetical protein